MSARTRNLRTSARLRSANSDEEIEAEDYNIELDEAEDEAGDDNMVDILGIIKQLQNQKLAKASSRSSVFQQKKSLVILDARRQADTLMSEGTTYIEQYKAKIDDLQGREATSDSQLKAIVSLWAAHEETVNSLLSHYPTLIEDLSPRRSKSINAASEMLETHPLARDISRRRLIKSAKKYMEVQIENQKIATDASELIKHYKALLLL